MKKREEIASTWSWREAPTVSWEDVALKKERKELRMKRREREAAEIRVVVEKWGGLSGGGEAEERDSQAPMSMKLPPAKAIENNPIVLGLVGWCLGEMCMKKREMRRKIVKEIGRRPPS